MSVLKRLFRRWSSRAAPRTRLDREQVRDIARRAAAGEPDCELLTLVTLSDDPGGRPIWIISTATVGSGLVVSVDDQSGEVTEMKRVGLR